MSDLIKTLEQENERLISQLDFEVQRIEVLEAKFKTLEQEYTTLSWFAGFKEGEAESEG